MARKPRKIECLSGKLDSLQLAVDAARIQLSLAESNLSSFRMFVASISTGAWKPIRHDLLDQGCVYLVREHSGREQLARWERDGWRGIDGYLAGPMDEVWIPFRRRGTGAA